MSRLKRLLDYVQPHLEQGERVEAFIEGAYEAKRMGSSTMRSGIFAATGRRLIFYAKKVGGYDFESFPYSHISSFEQSKGVMGHSMRFFVAGNTMSMKWIKDGAAFADFVALVTARTGQKAEWARSPADGDVFAALEKLGRLRDTGVVSPEEFEAKKAELLKRV